MKTDHGSAGADGQGKVVGPDTRSDGKTSSKGLDGRKDAADDSLIDFDLFDPKQELAAHGRSTSASNGVGEQGRAADPSPAELDLDLDLESVGPTTDDGQDETGDILQHADFFESLGQDAQALDVLRTAVASRPHNIVLRRKMFDLSVKLGDARAAEALARQLHWLSNGDAATWDEVQRVARAIDPGNPLYQPGSQPARVEPDMGVSPLSATATGAAGAVQQTTDSPAGDGIVPDQGPTRVETVADFDRLGRSKITLALTQLLVQRTSTHPMAVGMFGHWGTGKSSQIEFLKRSLGQHDRPRIRIAEFNAWKHERAEHLGAALAQVVVEALVRDLGLLAQLRLAVNLRALEGARIRRSLATDASRMVALLHPWLSTLPTVVIPAMLVGWCAFVAVNAQFDLWPNLVKGGVALAAAVAALPLLSNKFISDHLVNWFLRSRGRGPAYRRLGLPDFREKMGVNHEIHATLANLCELELKRPNDPAAGDYLLLVVDDLDRCEPSTVKEVFDAVRLVADVERVVTLVAIDERIAFAAVSKHFEKFGFAGREPSLVARDYLAKVFQVTVTLPEVTSKAAEAFVWSDLFGADLGDTEPAGPAPGSGGGSAQDHPGRSLPSPERTEQPARRPHRPIPQEVEAFGRMAAVCGFTNPRQLWRLKQAWQLLKGLVLEHGGSMSAMRQWMRVLFLREYMLQCEPVERRQIEDWLDTKIEGKGAPSVIENLADGPPFSSFADFHLRIGAVNTVLLPAAPKSRRSASN